MSEPKIFAEVLDELRRGRATAQHVRDALERDVEDLFHPRRYHQTSTPATPATEAPAMNLSSIGNDIKNSVEQGAEWLKQVSETHLPALIAEIEKYQASPIVQALEGLVLPPAMETQIANMIAEVAKVLPAAPVAPPAPVATDSAPVVPDAPVAQPAVPVA